jgi:flagellar hook-length control protein FliK
MESITFIPPTASPNPPNGQTRSLNKDAFSPALSKAVAKKNATAEQTPVKSSRKIPAAKREDPESDNIPSAITNSGIEGSAGTSKEVDSPQETPTTTVAKDTAAKTGTAVNTGNPQAPPSLPLPPTSVTNDALRSSSIPVPLNIQIPVDYSYTPVIGEPRDSVNTIQSNIMDPAGLKNTTPAYSQAQVFLSVLVQDAMVKQKTGDNLERPFNAAGTNIPSIPAAGQSQPETSAYPANSTTGAGQDTLLAQLQRILTEKGSENTVLYQQPGQQNQTAAPGSLFPPLYTLTTLSGQEQETAADPSDTGLSTAVAGLFIEKLADGKSKERVPSTLETDINMMLAKTETQGEKEGTKVQEKEAGLADSGKQQQANFINSSSSTDATGGSSQAGQFSLGSALTQNMQNGQHLTQTTGSNYLPPWTTAQENSLINQVSQHFQIHSGSSTSKLTLKLYPEELGELKIDIQMKDGSIKANIVTQNEQVHQVLEKYIPKLRSFMEQQGLSVDDILVTHSSGDVGKHDLFQEDFVNNHNFSSPENSGKQTSFANHMFENDLSEKTGAVSGVNVTV